MKKFTSALLAGAVLSVSMVGSSWADGKTIGVSWSNFQEERWKTDEAAMKGAIEARKRWGSLSSLLVIALVIRRSWPVARGHS